MTTTKQQHKLTEQLSIAQAAQRLNMSTETIRRLINRGELRAYRYGPRLIRIDANELLALREEVNPVGRWLYETRGERIGGGAA